MAINDAKEPSVTDVRTDGPTNGPTDRAGHRVACMRLNIIVIGYKFWLRDNIQKKICQ